MVENTHYLLFSTLSRIEGIVGTREQKQQQSCQTYCTDDCRLVASVMK